MAETADCADHLRAGFMSKFSFIPARACRLLRLLSVIFLCSLAPALNAQIIELTPGRDAQDVAQNVRFKTGFSGDIKALRRDNIANGLQSFESDTIQFGPINRPVLVYIPVKNTSSEAGAWIFTTGRGALESFTLFEVTDTGSRILLSSEQPEAFAQNLRNFQAISREIIVEAGEQRHFGFVFQTGNSTYLPLKIQSYPSFFTDRRSNIAMVSGVVVGALVLIFLNIIFFRITAKNEFLWLGLAEIAFVFNTLHAEGYTSIFLFPTEPTISMAFGDIVKCAFAIAMAQFARSFIQTQRTFPKTDLVLRALIYAGLGVIVLQLGTRYYSDNFRSVIYYAAWLCAVIIALILPFVGIFATLRLGRQYWPLILAWGSLGVFVLYAAIASSGIMAGLPINWHLAGPIGLFEAMMATLALGLHIRKIQSDKLAADESLTDSLRERLKISERANRLSSQNAMANATINDQNSLLHASGHDSRQVISALKSAVHVMSSSRPGSEQEEVKDILEASASYLENIVQTTMSGAVAGTDKKDFIALSGFTGRQLIDPLKMIYGRVCREKSLTFKTFVQPSIFIISDRALLMRAVSNYLSNSLKFTASGSIEIEIAAVKQSVKITIEDTGNGMTAQLAKRLNENTQERLKADDGFAGTGSGFMASKQIITLLGGTITIAPRDKGGSRVEIVIPAAAKKLTPCNLAYLESKTGASDFIDFDVARESVGAAPGAVSQPVIGVTYDDSPQTRRRAAQTSRLMLLKPLYREMAAHPALGNI